MFHLIFSLERKLNQKIPINGGGGSGQWSVMLAGSPSVVQGVRVVTRWSWGFGFPSSCCFLNRRSNLYARDLRDIFGICLT